MNGQKIRTSNSYINIFIPNNQNLSSILDLPIDMGQMANVISYIFLYTYVSKSTKALDNAMLEEKNIFLI